MKKLKKVLKNFLGKNFPVFYSKVLYFLRFKLRINLKDPSNFNEKLMWLKLNCYNNNPDVWKCSDKYLVRDYALKKGINEENLPKLLGVYQDANDIPYEKLPQKFALKCSHGCGFNIICTNKEELNIEKSNKQLNIWLKTKFGYSSAENHYTHIKPCIIIEEYIDSNEGLPYDYKLYCFYGVPKVVLVCSNREEELKLNFFNLDWEELPYGKKNLRNSQVIKKPVKLNEMVKLAKKISKDFPFVRVDFYQYKDKAILGEMTFTPAQCMAPYYSEFGQEQLSKLLNIKKNKKNR